MNTKDKFEYFYYQNLYPKLYKLDQQRKLVSLKILLILGIFIGLYVSLLFQHDGSSFISSVIFIPIICYKTFCYLKQDFVLRFKKTIIKDIAEFINPTLRVIPDYKIKEYELNATELFERNPDNIYVDDYFEGTIEKTNFKFCELLLKRGRGRNSSQLFRGLYFAADFNKSFNNRTLVMSNNSRITLITEERFSSKSIVELEDPCFNQEFTVYSDDQIEARYILSPAFMQRLIEFKKATGSKINLSFANNNLHLSIPISKNLFEPNIFSSIIDYKSIEEFYMCILFFTSIINDLNLNTRIWTKK